VIWGTAVTSGETSTAVIYGER